MTTRWERAEDGSWVRPSSEPLAAEPLPALQQDGDALDQHIRETAARLRLWGFEVTEASDGRADACDPYIECRVDPDKMNFEARKLLRLLRDHASVVTAIEAVYLPDHEAASLRVLGIDDDGWNQPLSVHLAAECPTALASAEGRPVCGKMVQGLPCGRSFKYGQCSIGHLEPTPQVNGKREAAKDSPAHQPETPSRFAGYPPFDLPAETSEAPVSTWPAGEYRTVKLPAELPSDAGQVRCEPGCALSRPHRDLPCIQDDVIAQPAPGETSRRPPPISDEERAKRAPTVHPAVMMDASEPSSDAGQACGRCNGRGCVYCESHDIDGTAPSEPAEAPLTFDWRRIGCGETSRSASLACAGNDGGAHDDVCDLVTNALESQHRRLGEQRTELEARLETALLHASRAEHVAEERKARLAEAVAKLGEQANAYLRMTNALAHAAQERDEAVLAERARCTDAVRAEFARNETGPALTFQQTSDRLQVRIMAIILSGE